MSTLTRNLALAALIGVCLACGGSSTTAEFDSAKANLEAKVIATGLTQPLYYIADPVHPSRAYVLEKGGKVKLLVNDVLQSSPVLDVSADIITANESGLLGMAFDPNFSSNNYVYLHYDVNTTPEQTRVYRYTMSADGTVLTDPYEIIGIDQPTASHKGGSINFGKDGMLYMALGDGATPEDDANNAQSGTSLLGKVLRIDVAHDGFPSDPEKNYAIPSDNPFANSSTILPEIWAVGFRNPYRWSVDPNSGALLLVDVGQDKWEEIDYIPAGKGGLNFGWRWMEGNESFFQDQPAFSQDFTPPIVALSHPSYRAAVGGFIYRGKGLDPQFRGRYIFADAFAPTIDSIAFNVSGDQPPAMLESGVYNHTSTINASLSGQGSVINAPVCVAPDANGEPILVQIYRGEILRIVQNPQS
ncbi:MAG: PQQ-dependent sugar dehydrogenase [Armatimonadetes bacterium]|nr:PQQ-dependent sugar dehydrogenase [Armatimonadota bacterium]